MVLYRIMHIVINIITYLLISCFILYKWIVFFYKLNGTITGCISIQFIFVWDLYIKHPENLYKLCLLCDLLKITKPDYLSLHFLIYLFIFFICNFYIYFPLNFSISFIWITCDIQPLIWYHSICRLLVDLLFHSPNHIHQFIFIFFRYTILY